MKSYLTLPCLLKTYCVKALGLSLLCIASYSQAATLNLSVGDSHTIKLRQEIDTVFSSAPAVVDYQLIGNNTLVAYAKRNGTADLTLFDSNGNQLLKTTFEVDDILSPFYRKIKSAYPSSQVTISKIGKSYVLKGTAPDEEAKEHIYEIVGEGLGIAAVKSNKKVSPVSQDSSNEAIEWLGGSVYPGVINQIKIPITNQVNVKLSIVEVTKAFTDNVGIDWGTVTGGGMSAGIFNLVKFNADSIATLIHAIGNESVARVLAEPNLSVLSGETANFLVGGEVPIVSNSGMNGTNVEYKEFGIKLNIGAKVSSNNKIRVNLGEEVSSLDSTLSTDRATAFPTFRTRRASSTVELKDGDSFLLAGLISNNEREELSKIPLLGDIPFLGAFFRHTKSSKERTELVVVATVNLVKPIKPQEVITPSYASSSLGARFFNFDAINNKGSQKQAMAFMGKGGFSQ